MDRLILHLLNFIPFLVCLTFHEFAHAYSATKFGDPTPRSQGRLTLNPLAHIDPIGTILVPLTMTLIGVPPFGWAKPVMVNPYNMREPAKHMMISTACGPLANIVQGIVFALGIRLYISLSPAILNNVWLINWLLLFPIIAFILALFNIIPLWVLDGREVLRYFLPYNQKVVYHEFNERYGMYVLFGMIWLLPYLHVDVLNYWFRPAFWATGFLTGLYGL